MTDPFRCGPGAKAPGRAPRKRADEFKPWAAFKQTNSGRLQAAEIVAEVDAIHKEPGPAPLVPSPQPRRPKRAVERVSLPLPNKRRIP
jgi:hypothetical protein